MSLNVDITKVKNWQENFPNTVYADGAMEINGTVKTVMYYCLLLNMSEINEKNIDDFYLRMKIWDKCFGCIGQIKGVPTAISYNILQQLIGLHTNISQETMATFWSKVRKGLVEDLQNEIRKEKQGKE